MSSLARLTALPRAQQGLIIFQEIHPKMAQLLFNDQIIRSEGSRSSSLLRISPDTHSRIWSRLQ